MWAIVGLGNPGERYVFTRHNVGFWVIDYLAGNFSAQSGAYSGSAYSGSAYSGSAYSGSAYSGSAYSVGDSVRGWNHKYDCDFLKQSLDGVPVLLVKPQKFMNLSGEALVPLLRFFKIEPSKLIVVHDELDLDPNILRLKGGGTSGGHNGVEDIAQSLGTKDFFRIRVGVGHPRKIATEMERPIEVTPWLLNQLSVEEREQLRDGVLNAAAAVKSLLQRGLKETQQRFHNKGK